MKDAAESNADLSADDYVFHVAEHFVSINGEARRAGEPAVFIRLAGCNLRCGYCDTAWAIDRKIQCDDMTAMEILKYIKTTGITNVTVTGGEPLISDNIGKLLEMLTDGTGLNIEVETNGAIDIRPYYGISGVSMTVDYKCPGSGMEKFMFLQNFEEIRECDTVKFVVSDKNDLKRMKEIIYKYDLIKKTKVYVSAVFGRIDPKEIVSFIIDNKLNEVRFQLQIHKFIWNPEKRGV